MPKIHPQRLACQPLNAVAFTLKECNNEKMNGATKLKIARVTVGFTQEQLADIVGISQQSLYKIESGIIRNPRKMPQIERALGVPPGTFQNESENDYYSAPHPLISACPLIAWEDVINWPKNKDFLVENKAITQLATACIVSGEAYATTVEDDSMTSSSAGKNFEEGDTIVVDPSLTPKNKSYVLCAIKNRIFLRQYREESITGKIFLVAKNGEQNPRIQLTDDIKILGVVVAHVDLSFSANR